MHPEIFEIPFIHLTVKSYGLMMVIAFLAAIFLIRRLSRDITPDPQYITNAALYSLIAGVIGSRLFYVVHHFDQFRGHLLSSFAIWQGGLELLGGVLAAITVIFFYLRYHKLPVRQYLDILAIGLMLALAFGRIGCFLNGCCFGRPTNMPWGVRFPYWSHAYYSQVFPDFARNRSAPQLKLPVGYFDYVEKNFHLDSAFQSELDNQLISRDLRSIFKNNGIILSQYARIITEQKGRRWLIINIKDEFIVTENQAGIEVSGRMGYLKPYEFLTLQQKEMLKDNDQLRSLPVHPTELYSSVNGAVLCLILYSFWRRARKTGRGPFKKPGQIFGLMFVLYGITRLLIEFLRDDNPFEYGWWAVYKGGTVSQNLGIYMAIFGLFLVLIFQRMKTQRSKQRMDTKA